MRITRCFEFQYMFIPKLKCQLKTTVVLSMTISIIGYLYLERIQMAHYSQLALGILRNIDVSLSDATTQLKAKHLDAISGLAPSTDMKSAIPDTPSFPRILHQTWDDEHVPMDFRAWMQTWRSLHPTWEFWFWTNADVLRLFKLHFPEYLSLYEGYPESLHRADAMRYFVLYKYGGVYADLDMEALKPLDPLLDTTPGCLISRETYEHAQLLYKKKTPVVMNCIMASRPGHPFFKLLQQSLRNSAKRKMALHATGPFFMDRVYLGYEHMQKKRGANSSSDSSIVVLNPKYLLPTFDPKLENRFRHFCKGDPVRPLLGYQEELCNKNKANNWSNRPLNISYTDHHWFHVSKKPPAWKHANNFHIDSLVPKRKNLKDILQ